MLSQKIQNAIDKALKNQSPVSVDSDHYIVGAFDLGNETLSLMSTMSKSVAEESVHNFKKIPDVHTIVVERPGVGMKVWIRTETDFWRTKQVNAARLRSVFPVDKDDLRQAAQDVLGMAREVLGATKKNEWESPEGRRKNWRRRLPDGTYEYRETPPGDDKPVKKEEKKEEKKPVKYKGYLHLDKAKLQETLTHGHFSVISAGRNPNDPKESMLSPDDEVFHKRHEELRGELEKAGLPYTEVVGHYGGKETSFLVFHDETQTTAKTQKAMMVHHRDEGEAKTHRKIIEALGKKFNQDSVLYGSAGRNEIVFTSGDKAGKTCGGNGWKEVPEAKDFYTDIKLEGTKHTKFSLDIHECFERGML